MISKKITPHKLTPNKTIFLTPANVPFKFFIIDAKDVVLGRLAAFLVNLALNKNSPTYSPHIPLVKIIVHNCKYVSFTGEKLNNKLYRHHTGFLGGLKERTAKEVINGKNSSDCIKLAIKGMMNKGPMYYKILDKNIQFFDSEIPENINISSYSKIDFFSINKKNSTKNRIHN